MKTQKKKKKKETTISRLRVLCPPPGVGVKIINAFDNGTLYIIMAICFVAFCYAKRD